MATKTQRKPKLTDAERHKRFVAMAREVEASDNPKAFDKAFKKVVQPGRWVKTGIKIGLEGGPRKKPTKKPPRAL
jgi:hypothetical protein